MYRCHRFALLASLCAAVAACGSVADKAGNLPDAALPTDDAPVAPVRGTVHVTVLDPAGTGVPAVGATVVFVDADGTVVKKTTDVAGKANADVFPGASVTSIVLVNTLYTLQTVLALKPDDDITLGAKNADTASAGTMAITVPTLAGATSYYVSTPCGATLATPPPVGGPPVAQATLTNDCKKSPFELVVVARDGSGNAIGSINIPSVGFLPNGTYTVPGTYGGVQSITASYTNINPIITKLQLSRVSPDAAGVVQNSQPVAPTAATASMTVNGGLSSKAQVYTTVAKGTGAMQIVRQPVAGTASTYGLDLATSLLPWIGQPSYDATATKLLVPIDTTGTSSDKPDLFGLQINYSRTDANQATTSFDWSVFGPDIGDVALPALPTDLGPLLPTKDDTLRINAAAFDAASLNGYDAVRNGTLATFTLYNTGRPADSNIRLTRCQLGRVPC